ncbi:MAG TPA: ATP-binding protein [Chitinophagaceae bacterium]|nr:ATP-binding protein [Chitinophagaceae bacterium]
MIKRFLQDEISTLLKQFPAVAILGPRQVGKTTLAKQIVTANKKDCVYLDMEKVADRNRLHDAHAYLESQQNRCVIIDEVQLMPQLLSELRPVIDEYRKPGRFILLGSASPTLVKGVSESLAGRISYTELTTVGLLEMPKNIARQKHWLRGGFPDALLAKTNEDAFGWMDSFTRSYIERDIDLLFRVNLSSNTMQRLWTMLAHANGSVWNAETFSRSLGITAPTVLRYVDYLEGGYMIRRLQPWFSNVKKRLVKSPKVYIRDSGLLHNLLHLQDMDDVLSHPVAGASWEGYVIEQVYAYRKPGIQIYYYRTHDGAECDLVLVKGIKPVCCIEIKLTNAPVVSKGFYNCIMDIKPKSKFVITPGSEDYITKDRVVITSLFKFLKEHLQLI